MHPESGFRVAPINWKNDDDIIICRHYIIVNFFFSGFCVSLVKLGYSPKFHVNIINSSGLTKIFAYKGFDQKSGNQK